MRGHFRFSFGKIQTRRMLKTLPASIHYRGHPGSAVTRLLSLPLRPRKKRKMKREKKGTERESKRGWYTVYERIITISLCTAEATESVKKKVSPSKIGVWGNISNRGRRVIFKGIEEYLLLDGGHWTSRDAGSEYLHKRMTAAACFVELEPVRILVRIAELWGMMREIRLVGNFTFKLEITWDERWGVLTFIRLAGLLYFKCGCMSRRPHTWKQSLSKYMTTSNFIISMSKFFPLNSETLTTRQTL